MQVGKQRIWNYRELVSIQTSEKDYEIITSENNDENNYCTSEDAGQEKLREREQLFV